MDGEGNIPISVAVPLFRSEGEKKMFSVYNLSETIVKDGGLRDL
jgi:hypothetical protein